MRAGHQEAAQALAGPSSSGSWAARYAEGADVPARREEATAQPVP